MLAERPQDISDSIVVVAVGEEGSDLFDMPSKSICSSDKPDLEPGKTK